jgi:hypothetical protein
MYPGPVKNVGTIIDLGMILQSGQDDNKTVETDFALLNCSPPHYRIEPIALINAMSSSVSGPLKPEKFAAG